LAYVLIWFFASNADAITKSEFTKIFLIASVPALAAVVVVAFFVRESAVKTANENDPDSRPVHLSLLGFDTNFKRFLIIIALFTLSNSSDAFLLLRAQTAGVSVSLIPLLWALLHVMKVVSSLFGGDLSDRLGRRKLIASGWILYAAVYAGFAFVSEAVSVWVLFLVYGIYFGLAEGAEKAMVADLVKPEQRGTAYGLYNLAFGITVLPASLLMGFLWKLSGPAVAFCVSAGLGALAALLLLTMVHSKAKA
jgi:predicted MFS family arabinose efflux permease